MNRKKILFIVISLVVIDQLSKYFAPIFGFEVFLNTGISLSLLSSLSNILLVFLMTLFGAIIFILFQKEFVSHPVPTGFFFGGAVSNVLDRVFYGAVRDWLKVPFFDISNNLADWFIFIGLIVFLGYNVFSSYIIKNK